MLRRLLVLFEPEAACRARMLDRGYPAEVADEIAFYLAQATDFAAVVEPLRERLARDAVELTVAALDDRDVWLPLLTGSDRAEILVWCLTDGFAWYRGSFVSSMAALLDAPQFGSPPAAQHLCQDKLRCLALARAAGLATPPSVLVEDDVPLMPVAVLEGAAGLFVKPNTLGAKLGIDADSHVADLTAALGPCRRIWRRYGDRALIQAYLPGRDVRVSFMALGDAAPLGIHAVRTSERGFATLDDSRRITAMREADGRSLALANLAGTPEGRRIEAAARHLARVAGLCDCWSMDFRLGEDGTPWFLELEVCPALTIYDFLTYLHEAHGVDLPEAMARAAAAAWRRRASARRT